RLTTSEQQLAAAQAQVAQLKEQTAMAAPVEPAPVPVPQSEFTASERQISQVLIVAQQSADKLVADARTNAENIRNEADQKAREVIRQALAEKQNELDEIDRLKQSREDFRAEYKKLLQHFMDDADSVFPQQTLSVPNGSKGTTHTDSVVASTPVIPAVPVADAEATTYAPAPAANDFSDLD
ncbi:MAG: DivIVA domain-containing protein, partial [Parafannyhessea umbonata]|nr:DivIVA domain-containing protein [Parafannyhessea umbonata]